MCYNLKIFTVFLLLCFATLLACAQKTIVDGTVVDSETNEAIPFAHLYFKGSKIGTTSDINGVYHIETYYSVDTLVATFIGYADLSKPIQKDKKQTLNFSMSVGSVELGAAVIQATNTENPAHPIIRNILKNKDVNNREKLDAYEYELYNKVEFDLNNLTDEFTDRKVFKPIEFVFDNLDSTGDKTYLPVFMTETMSNYFYRKNPKAQREIIEATQVSGIENNSVSQFLGDMYQNVNVYDNNIIVFGKSFVSPISNSGFSFYRYYLMDSTYIEGKWCFQIKFQPKRKQELTFDGDFWVNDTTFAIKQLDARIAGDANINFVQDLWVEQTYNEIESEVWMLTEDHLIIDFNITKKTMGFFGRKTSTHRNFVINQAREDKFYTGLTDVIVAEDANDKDAEFWQSRRHVELTESEVAVYNMVDSLQTIPQFRTVADLITLFISGYKVIGLFEFGPYYTLYSFNPIEGNRVRLGGRTSNAFSKRLMIEGYGAYGFLDHRFKYGGGLTYILKKNPRMSVYVGGKSDVEQLGQAQGAFREDNVLSSLFRRNPANKLTSVEEVSGSFEREWFYGFANQLSFKHRKLQPLGSFVYEKYSGENKANEELGSLKTSELTLYTRFAFKEKFVAGEFERISLGTNFPILELVYSYGIPNFFGSDYEYHKAVIRVKDKIRLGPIGYIRVQLEAGKFWGNLPYPLLQLHQGNETFFYDESAFNTMNFFEFVSDEWVSTSLSYHLEGLLLNKIPLIRKLKWREVVSAKAVIGQLDEANADELLIPSTTFALQYPFVEAAVGIENIFTFFRIDALYRLSYLDNPDIVRFGIRAKLQVEF